MNTAHMCTVPCDTNHEIMIKLKPLHCTGGHQTGIFGSLLRSSPNQFNFNGDISTQTLQNYDDFAQEIHLRACMQRTGAVASSSGVNQHSTKGGEASLLRSYSPAVELGLFFKKRVTVKPTENEVDFFCRTAVPCCAGLGHLHDP